MTDSERETFIRQNRWIVNVDTAFLFRRLDEARHYRHHDGRQRQSHHETGIGGDFSAGLHMMIDEARADERRKAATIARSRVPPEMADYIEQQVLEGGAG